MGAYSVKLKWVSGAQKGGGDTPLPAAVDGVLVQLVKGVRVVVPQDDRRRAPEKAGSVWAKCVWKHAKICTKSEKIIIF